MDEGYHSKLIAHLSDVLEDAESAVADLSAAITSILDVRLSVVPEPPSFGSMDGVLDMRIKEKRRGVIEVLGNVVWF